MIAKKGLYWQTAEGWIVHPSEMNTGHLFNAFKMVFNHLVEAFRHLNPDFYRVNATVYYPSVTQACEDFPEIMIQYLHEFAEELSKRELTPRQQQVIYEILNQLLPKFKSERKNQCLDLERKKKLIAPVPWR